MADEIMVVQLFSVISTLLFQVWRHIVQIHKAEDEVFLQTLHLAVAMTRERDLCVFRTRVRGDVCFGFCLHGGKCGQCSLDISPIHTAVENVRSRHCRCEWFEFHTDEKMHGFTAAEETK